MKRYLEIAAQDIDPAFGNWFVGFFEGEGCFGARVAKRAKQKNGRFLPDRAIHCWVAINLRYDDLEILTKIREKFGGSLSQIKRSEKDVSRFANASPLARWTLDNKKSALQMVEFFDSYKLRTKKRDHYVIWREIVLAVVKKEHLGVKRDWVLHLCQLLKDVKKFNSNIQDIPKKPKMKNRQLNLLKLSVVKK